MAQEARFLRLLMGFYANRIDQLQRQIDELEQARNELMNGERELRTGEEELEQARKELRTGQEELDRTRTELEQAGNEQRIGQEELANLKIRRDQLVSDEESLRKLKDTFCNHTAALTTQKDMLALYRKEVDQLVEKAKNERADLERQVQILEHDHLNQDFVRGLGARVGRQANEQEDLERQVQILERDHLNQDFVGGLGDRVGRQAQQDIGLGKSFVMCCSAAVMYLVFASLLVYNFFDDFSSTKGGSPLVDACYMTFVTTFTIGYGDIVPREVTSKILCDALVVVGHVVPFIFCYYMDRMAERWDRVITSTVESERSRLCYRVLSSIVVIIAVIFSGVGGIYIFEMDQPVGGSLSPSPSLSPSAMAPTEVHSFWDSFHLSVMTVTSAGYGDVSFVTAYGRAFAIFWIPFSVTIYSGAMTFLTRHTLRAFRGYITGHTGEH